MNNQCEKEETQAKQQFYIISGATVWMLNDTEDTLT